MTKRLGKILKSTCQKWKKVPISRAKKRLEKFDLFPIKITKKEIEDQIKK